MSVFPQLISVKEFAKRLGVSACWVYRHARELNGVKLGTLWRFSESQNPRLQISKPTHYYPQPRRYQRGSVYRTPNGWRGCWREDVVLPDGRLKRKPCHRIIGTIKELPTKSAARNRMAEIIRGMTVTTEITLNELHDRWQRAIGPTLKPPTVRYYKHIFDKHILPSFGLMQIKEISRYQVQMFLAGKAAKYATPSLHGMRTALQKVLTWATECDWLKANPCSGVKIPRSGTKRKRFVLTPQQVLLLASRLPKMEATLVIFLAVTGLRISEAAALRFSDIEPDGIHVRRRLFEGKTDEVKTEDSERTVPTDITVIKMLGFLRESESDDWIFRSGNGTPMNPGNSLRRKIKPAIRALELPNIGYHDFRHTLISWLGTAKNSPKMIAEIVGHSDINTTLSVYTHPSMEEKRNALANVSTKLLNGV